MDGLPCHSLPHGEFPANSFAETKQGAEAIFYGIWCGINLYVCIVTYLRDAGSKRTCLHACERSSLEKVRPPANLANKSSDVGTTGNCMVDLQYWVHGHLVLPT